MSYGSDKNGVERRGEMPEEKTDQETEGEIEGEGEGRVHGASICESSVSTV